ncbi:RNA polymerase sigma factor SigF [Nocardia sp. CNY236]|uniref:RNA polymerase sigma factor SigF n=1 Tax=Nocardia sp. CNY236 TaxID=1169152 RepID=UPI000416D6D8|nr:RNA polymerase sigma factor SigF [Nocardia sp. CNY236]
MSSTSNRGAAKRASKPDSYDNIEPLFVELAALSLDDPRREAVRTEVIGRCLPLADHIARKFSGRGENFEDLVQIARVGMLAAVDRFDPTRGATFLSFAVPTIVGEVRRHFRDYAWSVRVPRRIKEIQSMLGPTVETLSQRLGRVPRAREIAEELGVDLNEVTQALIARNAYKTSSIDAVSDIGESDSPGFSVLDSLGAEDPDFGIVDNCLAVTPLLAALPDREKQVLAMRFFDSMSQEQIARQIGCSQMQVSRILAKTLKSLREQALRD